MEALKGQRVPRRSQVWRLKEPTAANMVCYRCSNEWGVAFDPAADAERMCPACRSNSVRVVLDDNGCR
jgi:hypothetical protein